VRGKSGQGFTPPVGRLTNFTAVARGGRGGVTAMILNLSHRLVLAFTVKLLIS